MHIISRLITSFICLVLSLALFLSWYNKTFDFDMRPITSTKRKEDKTVAPEKHELNQEAINHFRNLSCASSLSSGFGCIKRGDLKNRHLQLIHITKTGGSAIEDIALEAGIKWGFRNKDFLRKFGRKAFKAQCSGEQWHWPLKFFRRDPYRIIPDTDLFTIVRNPYTRIISEYRWEVGTYRFYRSEGKSLHYFSDFMKFIDNEENASSPVVLNNYIQKRLKKSKDPCTHYRRQTSYIFDGHEKKKVLIENILRFEDLQNQFNYLMKAYNLNLKLPADYRHQEAKVDFHFSVDELWNSTKQTGNMKAL